MFLTVHAGDSWGHEALCFGVVRMFILVNAESLFSGGNFITYDTKHLLGFLDELMRTSVDKHTATCVVI